MKTTMNWTPSLLPLFIIFSSATGNDDYIPEIFPDKHLTRTQRCKFLGNCDDYHTQSYSITCCSNGEPEPYFGGDEKANMADSSNTTERSIVLNFTMRSLGPANGFNDGCIRYAGEYNVNEAGLEGDMHVEVHCRCPHSSGAVDRNCRVMQSDCENGGQRRFAINLRCACPDPYFGRLCQFECRHGRRIEGTGNVSDYCQCQPLYHGRDCSRSRCANGGIPSGPVCWCPQNYHGSQCQYLMTSSTDQPDSSVHQVLRRDFTGTVISLILVVTLLTSMYCMLRRRLQLAQRRQHLIDELIQQHMHTRPFVLTDNRRPGAVNMHDTRNNVLYHLPPIYSNTAGNTPNGVGDEYPPLPSYDDLIKSDPSISMDASPERQSPPPMYDTATTSAAQISEDYNKAADTESQVVTDMTSISTSSPSPDNAGELNERLSNEPGTTSTADDMSTNEVKAMQAPETDKLTMVANHDDPSTQLSGTEQIATSATDTITSETGNLLVDR